MREYRTQNTDIKGRGTATQSILCIRLSVFGYLYALFVFDKQIHGTCAEYGYQNRAKGEDKIHFLFLNSSAPARSMMIMPSAIAQYAFKSIFANCKAKKPFTKIPSPIFRLVLKKSSKILSFIKAMITQKSKFTKEEK